MDLTSLGPLEAWLRHSRELEAVVEEIFISSTTASISSSMNSISCSTD